MLSFAYVEMLLKFRIYTPMKCINFIINGNVKSLISVGGVWDSISVRKDKISGLRPILCNHFYM